MMKSTFLILLLWMGWPCAFAQKGPAARLISVTTNKTTSLVFPSSIGSVDRGSERIIVQKATGTVLRVKADTSFTDTTNLTVITTDGKLYSFLVCYSPSPQQLTIDLGAGENINQDTSLASFARKVSKAFNRLYGIRYGSGKVWLSLLGIYTNGELIGCKLKIENGSPLSFEIGRISVMVGGKHRGRRRASHEQELPILLSDIPVQLIRERQAGLVVILLPKSGLSPGQALQLQVQEKGGERHLSLSISNRFILSAYLIPSL